jgi:uncharacterized coiled-coil DUF342 family protein
MSTEQERQTIKARYEASLQPPWYVYAGNASDDVGALLADVDRLTQERDGARANVEEWRALAEQTKAERDALAAELAQVRAQVEAATLPISAYLRLND